MEKETKKTTVTILLDEYEKALAAANKVLKQDTVDMVAYNKAIETLKEVEAAYAAATEMTLYDKYAKMDNPTLEIIKLFTFDVKGHTEVKDDNDKSKIIEVKDVVKKRRIDLLKFHERAKIDTAWKHTVTRVNQLLCLRLAQTLELSKDKVSKIAKSMWLSRQAAALDMGKTPTSKTQVCKLLQQVYDEMLPNIGEDGKSAYKVTNKDVNYLDAVYAKMNSKDPLTVLVSKDTTLRSIFLTIAHAIITNEGYNIGGYKTIKAKKESADVASIATKTPVKAKTSKASAETETAKKAA